MGGEDQVHPKPDLPGNGQKPRNWVEVLTGNRDTANGWSLVYSPLLVNTHVVQITPEESEEASAVWRNSLIGFVAGAKPRFREMEGYVKVRWMRIGAPTVHMLQEGMFLFDFCDEDRNKVLEQNWAFRGQPLILRPWTPDVDINKLEVEKVPVWVQLPRLPLSCWTSRILGEIVSCIELPLATDMLTAKRGWLNYARVLVEMKVSSKLIYEVPVDVAGKSFKQEIVYEWLPLKCGRCTLMGHDTFSCKKPEQQVWVDC